MDLKIDPEALNAIVSRAILEGISQEKRDLLLQQAVTALITPPRDTYGRAQETPIQGAFNRAAQAVCHTVAREMVENNAEFVAKVRELVGESVAEAMEQNFDLKMKVSSAVADALVSWKADR